MDWIELAQDRDSWWVLVKVAMNLRFPSNAGNLLTTLDFKISPFFVLSVLSFGYFPGVWFILADVSEHSIYSSK
jgi:hypothetical protein